MANSRLFSSPDDKLENALLLLATGLPLSKILAEAGDDAAWLGPLLQMAAEIGDLGQAVPVPPAEPSLRRMLDYGQELSAGRSPAVSTAGGWQAGLARLFGSLFPRLAAGQAALLLVIVLVGGAATVLAQQSLPGQPLYPLKRASETLRLNFTPDPQDRARLRNDFNQRRQEETHLLLQQNRVAPVAFEGQVESVTLTSLRVAGWTAQLTSQTEIRGNLAAGARIRLEALTQPPDQLIVLSVTVLEPAPPTPTATATLAPEATATPGVSQTTDTLVLPTATPTPVLSRATDVLPLPAATLAEPVPPVLSPPAPQPDEGNTNDNTNEDRGDDDVGDETEDNTNDSDGNDGGDNSGSSDDDRSGSDNSGGGDDHSSSNDDNSGSDDKDDRDDKDDG